VAISYAYKGTLVRNVSLEELRAFLTSMLVTPARSRRWLTWIKSWTGGDAKPGPVAVAREQTPEAAPNTTSLAK